MGARIRSARNFYVKELWRIPTVSQAQSGRTGDGSIQSRNIALVYVNRRCGIIITIRIGSKRNIIAVQGGTVHIDRTAVFGSHRESAFLDSSRTALKSKRVSTCGNDTDTATNMASATVTHINSTGIYGNAPFIPWRCIRQGQISVSRAAAAYVANSKKSGITVKRCRYIIPIKVKCDHNVLTVFKRVRTAKLGIRLKLNIYVGIRILCFTQGICQRSAFGKRIFWRAPFCFDDFYQFQTLTLGYDFISVNVTEKVVNITRTRSRNHSIFKFHVLFIVAGSYFFITCFANCNTYLGITWHGSDIYNRRIVIAKLNMYVISLAIQRVTADLHVSWKI